MNLESLRDLLVTNAAFENPFVCAVVLSPAIFQRVKGCVAVGTMPACEGVEITQSAALLDHMAHLRFANGGAGYWDMRGDKIQTWKPMGMAL